MPKRVSFCSIGADSARKTGPARTRVLRFRPGFGWSGVKTDRYKAEDGSWASVLRRVLVGAGGEKTKFHLRYFEIAPGGYTTFECHRHEHVVVGVRGRGKCRAGKKTYGVGFMDTLYICPGEPHQLSNPHTDPFGFFCIVDAKRDRPKGVADPRPKKRAVVSPKKGSATPKRGQRPLPPDESRVDR